MGHGAVWSLDDIKTAIREVLAADRAGLTAQDAVEFDQVRHPEKWWRPDGSRPVVGESTKGLLWHDPTKQHDDGELKAVRAFRQAIESGDHSRLDDLAEAAFKAEKDHDKRVAHAKAQKARADKKAAEEADKIGALIDQGWDPDEAESEVTGQSVTSIRIRNFLARSDSSGTFSEVARQAYFDEVVVPQSQQAESATRSRMIKPEYETTVSGTALWLMGEKDAKKYMSEEAARWFNQYGRYTYEQYRQGILDGHQKYKRQDGYMQ